MPSKTITATGSKGHHIFDLYVNETSTSTANNTSTVAFTFSMRPTGYDWYWSPPSKPVNYTVIINGVNYSGTIYQYTANTTLTIKTGTQTVTHNSNGKKTIDISFSVASLDFAYLPGSASANGTLTLADIARYPSITQSLSGKTETTLTVKWSSDSTIDILYYSTNNGSSWTTVDVADGKSGTYTITGLSAGTSYNVKTRVHSKASGLTTDSSASAFSTNDYPFANSMPNFTIGQSVKIGLSNPHSRSVTVELLASGGTVAGTATTSGTSVTLTPTAATLYASIPNAKSANYSVRVTYGSQTRTKTGGTYSANTNTSAPSATALAYADTYSRVISVTGNNQLIVQGRSRVTFTLTGLAGYEGSTISSVSLSVNGATYSMTISGTTATVEQVTINSPTDVTATATITDSRGITGTKSVTVTMIEYADPTLRVSAVRKNNFYSETDIKADATIASINGRNSIRTLSFQYKRSDDTGYGNWTDITSGQAVTVSLDNAYAWTIHFRIQDSVSTTIHYYATVLEGTPIMFIDRNKRSVSLNGFPNDDESFEVGGHDLRRHVITASLTSPITSPSSQTYSQITLDSATSFGDKLSLNYGSVVIGANVSKVMVSAFMSVHTGSVSSVRSLRICKNSFSDANTVGWSWESASASEYVQLVIPPLLIDVAEGDEIELYYYVQSGDEIAGTFGGRTSLTVDFIA